MLDPTTPAVMLNQLRGVESEILHHSQRLPCFEVVQEVTGKYSVLL